MKKICWSSKFANGGGLVAKSCLTHYVPKDWGSPGSSVLGISQARILSGLPFPSPGELPNPWIEPRSPTLLAISCFAGGFFTE